jgi:GDPmannose 4,6-dehydratase
MKKAIIFGVTGQDGAYLARFLLQKGYEVFGVSRRTSLPNNERLTRLGVTLYPEYRSVRGDVTDAASVHRIISMVASQSDVEIYNLAAQSHVGDSFHEPTHTTNATYLGALNCLEAINSITPRHKVRFYQAGSSEMFGSACSARKAPDLGDPEGYQGQRRDFPQGMPSSHRAFYFEPFQDELTPMLPNSPYAIAKLAAHHLVRVYRESYCLFACSGILFNHESEYRGENFVTRKISMHVARCAEQQVRGLPLPVLELGNIHAKRDWGHAEDYVRGMWLMLQQETPDDYVLATGETHSVEQFYREAFAVAGIENYQVAYSSEHDRPCEVPYLRGLATKAHQKLGWKPEINFTQLVKRMVYADMSRCPLLPANPTKMEL